MPEPFVERQTEAMRLWAEANGNRAVARKLDWSKTWRNWLLREWRPDRGSTGPPSFDRERREAAQRSMENFRRLAAEQGATGGSGG